MTESKGFVYMNHLYRLCMRFFIRHKLKWKSIPNKLRQEESQHCINETKYTTEIKALLHCNISNELRIVRISFLMGIETSTMPLVVIIITQTVCFFF